MSVDLELANEPVLETNECKVQKTEEDSNNLVMVQAQFRTYLTCKSFGLIKKKHLFSLTELFTDFSLFKGHFFAYIHNIIIDYLEKSGLYFKLNSIEDKPWNGPVTTDLKNFYYGEIDEQRTPQGCGVLISFKSFYQGQFSNGKFDNKGRMIDYKDGVYDGDWQSGQKDGNGTMVYWNGSKYSGNWKNDQKHGQGILDETDSHYEGNFENNLKSGYGEQVFENQKVFYKGNFVNGSFEGFGLLINKEYNESYEGEFKSGVYHGKGRWVMRDGWTYIGDFVMGNKSGFGVIQNHNEKFESEWRNNIPQGEYTLHSTKTYPLYGFWNRFEPKNHMDEVIGNLFLGNYLAATNEGWLREIGIKHIIRVLGDENVELLPGFNYLYIKAKDSETENITKYLPEALEFIHCVLKERKKLLVHCYAGVSRSPTIVLAFIMKKFRKSFDEAYQYLKDRRPCIKPNRGFLKQLQELDVKKKIKK